MKKLAYGDVAPTFTVHDVYDKEVILSPSYQHSTLIAFLRFSACPFCNLAIHRLTTEYDKLQAKGINVIAFVQSDKARIQKHIIDAHAGSLPFPLIPKQRPNVYKMYGVTITLNPTTAFASIPLWIKKVLAQGFKSIDVDSSVFQAQALFLISPAGSVLLSKYVTNIYDQKVFDEVYAAADLGARL